jgi:outer membrane protein
MRVLSTLAIALLVSSALVPAARAQDDGAAGHFQIRVRALGILPQGNGNVTANGAGIGGSTHVTDSSVPEVDGSYFLTDHIALELIAATTKHAVHRDNSALGNVDVGSVWLLPPTLTLQYHFDPEGTFRPYVGAGVNYTYYYSPENTGILNDVKYQSNWGGALQAGIDIPVTGPFFVNFDVKKLFLNASIKAVVPALANAGIRASDNLDPWIVGAGVGVRL